MLLYRFQVLISEVSVHHKGQSVIYLKYYKYDRPFEYPLVHGIAHVNINILYTINININILYRHTPRPLIYAHVYII